MASGEEMYELLKRRDAEISALRELLKAIRSEYAQLASQLASEREYEEATHRIDLLFYEHGFKSDGRFRG